MKVFDLFCDGGHRFEGWFASEADYLSQQERGLVTCPVCSSGSVARRPSAPRLNLHGGQAVSTVSQRQGLGGSVPAETPAPVSGGRTGPDMAGLAQAGFLRLVRQVIEHTEDVGERFAEEARKIHYGETDARGIRGQTSAEDLAALKEEGVSVMTLPIPAGLDKPRH